MLSSTTLFARTLAQWASAIEESDFVTARKLAEEIKTASKQVAIHPDFHRCIEKHFFGMMPEQLVNCVTKFLLCATEVFESTVKRKP